MSGTTSPGAIARAALTGRAAYGILLLAAPQLLLRTASGRPTPRWAPAVVRVLGARHLVQYRVLAVHPDLAVAGTAVDLAHALTDVLEAYLDRAMRPPALLDSAVATTLALASLAADPV